MARPHTAMSLSLLAAALCLSPWTQVFAQESASDYFVRSLPGAPAGPLLRMHAGHVQVDMEHHGSLFFWHYQNRHIEDRPRTVIWLNGGPGCSSMDGNLMEVGPYRVREGGKLEYNEGSWDQFANLLFVDSPVGTGFSFVDSNSYVHELDQMADHFITFLENWFNVFPEHESNELYLAGESYAGQHIPYIAKAIMKRNESPIVKRWNLKGLLIGNGWISGEFQSPSNLKYAFEKGLIKEGSSQADTVQKQQDRCISKLEAGEADHVDTLECENILRSILEVTWDKSAASDKQCVNMYDVKLRDSYPSCGMNWPPDLRHVTPYLRDHEVLREIHVDAARKPTAWTECNGQVSASFSARNSVPSFKLLPAILTEVPILLFSGEDDMICNHIGTESMIEHLSWNGGVGFGDAPSRKWDFDGQHAGTFQEARNLTYVLFHNSSHMVPFDYPLRAMDMLHRFIGVEPSLRHAGSVLEGESNPSTGTHDNVSDPTEQPHESEDQVTDGEEEEGEEEIDEVAAEAALEQARWDAYYRSGEVALVFVVIMASAWFWWVWRDRRRRAGYRNVVSDVLSPNVEDMRMEGYRHKKSSEAEAEEGHANGNGVSAEQARRYSLGSLSESSTEDRDDRRH